MTKEIGSGMTVGLEQEVFADLSAELIISDKKFDETLLLAKIRNAMREVKRARNYPKCYTDGAIEQDMYDYFSNIRNIALYDYNQIGGEFQQSNSEPGSSQAYVDRNELFNGICPFARVI